MIELGAVFRWPIRVYYEDTDAGGIVYYANYLKFMERARSEWLRSRGVDLAVLAHNEDAMFVVRSANLEFLRPARLSDDLEVSVQVAHQRPASVELSQVVTRSGETLCTGVVRLACINIRTARPRPLPDCFENE
ncbi:MAG TPA: tol-pal system-associated acyl-CoA thioesterase [Gammaproteobacteria bacterium]|jgi:acyl-CoA thioester hydrolase|nr:tol-pal system-associated acyl-CoA thioesterase [Gammaproteobacteria bacterium]